jgi:hypothetical protein
MVLEGALNSPISPLSLPHLKQNIIFAMFAQRFHRILAGASTKSASRIHLQTVRYYADSARVDLLESIYGPPFANLKKGSPEYIELGESGRIGENHFQPGNIEPYLQAQSDLKTELASIDEFKEFYHGNQKTFTNICRALVPVYAQQSTSLELIPVYQGDAGVISDKLDEQIFNKADSLGTMSLPEVSKLALPTPEELLPRDKCKPRRRALKPHLRQPLHNRRCSQQPGHNQPLSRRYKKPFSASSPRYRIRAPPPYQLGQTYPHRRIPHNSDPRSLQPPRHLPLRHRNRSLYTSLH